MRPKNYLSFLLTVFISVQGIMLGSCTTTSTTYRGTIKLGLVAPFSGQDYTVGYNMLFAAKLAIKEWNESDRLNGYRVELLAQDDRNEAEPGLMQAKKMVIDRDVIGVVGHPSNASAIAAADVYSKAGLAMVTTEATSDAFSTGGFYGVFRLGASDSKILSETARFVEDTLKAQKLAIVSEPKPDDIAFSSRFYDVTHADGLSLTFGEPLKPEQAEFGDLARRMSYTDPQVVFFSGDYLNAGVLLSQMRQQQMKSHYIFHTVSPNPLFLKAAGESAEGTYIVSLAPNPTDVPAATDFVQAYRSLAGQDPLPSALLTYDATNLILSAVEKTLKDQPNPDRQAVVTALQSVRDFQGLSSTITFDENGAAKDPKVYFYLVKGFRFPGERQQTASQ